VPDAGAGSGAARAGSGCGVAGAGSGVAGAGAGSGVADAGSGVADAGSGSGGAGAGSGVAGAGAGSGGAGAGAGGGGDAGLGSGCAHEYVACAIPPTVIAAAAPDTAAWMKPPSPNLPPNSTAPAPTAGTATSLTQLFETLGAKRGMVDRPVDEHVSGSHQTNEQHRHAGEDDLLADPRALRYRPARVADRCPAVELVPQAK
jgi:hypothetical protein